MAKSRPSKPRRTKAHSLLAQYGKLPKNNRTVSIKIEDPYATSAYAIVTAIPPPGRAVTDDGPTEWRAPDRPRIEVLASTRDVIAGMFARHQIDEAMFAAAQKYQSVYERAASLSHIRTVDVSMPPISGIQGTPYESAAQALAATKELKRLEKALQQRAGEDGVGLVRDVLGAGKTIERAAVERGDRDRRRVEWWGGMFRRSLRHLAEIAGFAVQGAYRNRHKQMQREQAQEKRREKKDGSARSEGPGPASAQGGVPGWPILGDLQSVAGGYAACG